MRLAVNIEQPADLSALADYYHPTSQSIEFVRNLATTALNNGGAHALMGAYGIGKSSLAAFALNELACATGTFVPKARTHLFGEAQNPVAEVVDAGGLAPIPVVGAAEPLASRVTSAVQAFSRSFPAGSDGLLTGEGARLDPRTATEEQALTLLRDAARTVRELGRPGALLVIDEFGRHLEHMVASASDSDFHLLQSIAEATGQPDDPPERQCFEGRSRPPIPRQSGFSRYSASSDAGITKSVTSARTIFAPARRTSIVM